MAIKKKSLSNPKSAEEKDYHQGGRCDRDAFERALDKAHINKDKVKAIQVGEKKAKPKIEEGRYLAITTEAQLERNIESKYGPNDRVTISFEIFIDEDFHESILLTERFWASGNESSRYCQILSKLLQFDARTGFRMEDVIGVTSEIIIVHNETSSGIYANIADLEVIILEEN